MDIYYLGHSSFRISTKNVGLVTDPYEPGMLGFKFPKVESNIVTISHDHNDHNQHVLVDGNPKVITGAGEYEIGGVSIIGIPSFHDDKKGEERGENTIFIFEIEGMRLVHLGDLGHALSDADISLIGDVDVLMVPVGGIYTLGPKEAAAVVRSLEPSIIVPMHFKTDDINTENFSELSPVSDFLSEVGLPHEEAAKLSLKEGSISPDEQKVVVLTRK